MLGPECVGLVEDLLRRISSPAEAYPTGLCTPTSAAAPGCAGGVILGKVGDCFHQWLSRAPSDAVTAPRAAAEIAPRLPEERRENAILDCHRRPLRRMRSDTLHSRVMMPLGDPNLPFRLMDQTMDAAKHTKKPSIYTGTSGTALMLYHMVLSGAALSKSVESRMLTQAAGLARGALPRFSSSRFASFLEGESGGIALLAAIAHRLGDVEECEFWRQKLLDLGQKVKALPKDDCELLYGRCGFLWSILFVRSHCHMPRFGGSTAVPIIRQVLNAGTTRESKRLHYTWHGKEYYGAAHGLAGILYTLFHFDCTELQTAGGTKGNDAIRNSLFFLCSEASRHPSGNPRSSSTASVDRLVQWCHGAPGLISLFLKASEKLPEFKTWLMNEALYLGRIVWRRTNLVKGCGLCHGTAGNGYCLLSLYRATGDGRWLMRALSLARKTAQSMDSILTIPDEPYSTYNGIGGFVCFLQDLRRPALSKFPGWELP